MSSFSSVVRKPGVNIKPKAPIRRNVSRRVNNSTPLSASDHEVINSSVEQHTSSQVQSPDDGNHPQSENLVASSSDATDYTPVLPSVHVTNDIAQPSRGSSAKTTEVNSQPPQDVATAQEGKRYSGPAALVGDADSTLKGNVPEGAQVNDVRFRMTRASPMRSRASSVVSHGQNTENSQQDDSISGTAHQRQKLPKIIQDSQTSGNNTSVSISDLAQSGIHRTDEQGQPIKDLLQLATEQAASVSSLANDIETRTRARNSLLSTSDRSGTVNVSQSVRQTSEILDSSKSKKRKRKTAAEQAAEVVANATRNADGRMGNRSSTPEGAGSYLLAPDEVTMGELVLDRKLGKKSQLEEDMQRDWTDIVQRRKEARNLALENAQKGRRKVFGGSLKPPVQATISIRPRTEIRNGKIVVIEESRQIDRNGALEQAALLDAENVREDKLYYKRVNQNTVGMKAHAGRKFRWDEESTEQFFNGLRMFGTDFLMIANLFPGLDRKQIKTKFIREENADKPKVMEALANRLPINLEEYSKIAELDLEDPAILQAEIDAEEQRLKDEDHERRVREGFVNANAADNPIPSREGNEDMVENTSADGTSRYAAVAEEIMAPKKRQRKASSSIRKKSLKAARRPAEGVEEVLGSIDEVRV